MPRAQLPHAAASFAVAVTVVSPQSMAQNPRTIVLQAPKKRRSMRKTAKVILGLGVHAHRGGGELSLSGTWGCTPISGGRTLTLRDLGVPAHCGGRTLTLRDLGVHAHQREANSHPQAPDGLRRSFWWEGQ